MKCPKCKANKSFQTRIRRKWFIKPLLKSKVYKCYHCELKYISWFTVPLYFNLNLGFKAKPQEENY